MDECINEPSPRRTCIRLALICTFVYFSSYVTRIDLAAVLVAVEETGFSSRSDAALALALTAIAYGIGQMISGWLADRYDPRHVVFCGLLLTACCNAVAGVTGGSVLAPLWALNGLAQSFMWPPIVRILAANLPPTEYNRASMWVNMGGLVGTMSVYLCAPYIIKLLNIRFVFWFAGTIAIAAAFIWIFATRLYASSPKRSETNRDLHISNEITGGRRVYLFILIMASILILGALRDGISNWMPTFLSDRFGLESSSAVLSGALLPICGILSYLLTQQLHKRVLKNELLCASVIFATGAAAAFLLRFFQGGSSTLSTICLAIVAGSMHGVNLMLICIVPPFFAKNGKVGSIAGIMNAGVYAGSAIATYGIPLISSESGKNSHLDLCLAAALCGMIFCAASVLKWNVKENDK